MGRHAPQSTVASAGMRSRALGLRSRRSATNGGSSGRPVAYEMELERERTGARDPWDIVDEVMAGSKQLGGIAAKLSSRSMRSGWASLDPSGERCCSSEPLLIRPRHQALRIYDRTSRAEAGSRHRRCEVLQNPYRLFESGPAEP